MSEEKPETKPNTETKPDATITTPKIIKEKVEVEKKLTEDEMVVSKAGFTNMQKSLLELQKKDQENEKEKAEMIRVNLLTQLTAINPKYAELHKESNKDMLLGALATAKAEANQFTELNAGKDTPTDKPSADNHTSYKYNWVESKKAEKPTWDFM